MRIQEPTPEELGRIAETAQQFRGVCVEQDILITSDGRIGECDAAELLGYAKKSLENLRSMGGGPAYYRRRAGTSKISYRIRDLADWIEATRED